MISGRSRVLMAAAAVLLAGTAFAQGRGRFDWRRMMPGRGADAGVMIEHGGKLYVVCEATLARVDFDKFEVETRADLSKVGRDAEKEKKEREAWIAQFDENGDKILDEGDGGRWRWVRSFDGNGDGRVTPEEAGIGPAPGASGPASLKVVRGKLVMLRGGMIFRFALDTLKLEASERIPPPEPEREEEADEEKKQGGRQEKVF